MDFTKTTIWTGNTYPIREELKAEGAAYNGETKTWIMPPVTGQAETVRVSRLWLKPGVEVREA